MEVPETQPVGDPTSSVQRIREYVLVLRLEYDTFNFEKASPFVALCTRLIVMVIHMEMYNLQPGLTFGSTWLLTT